MGLGDITSKEQNDTFQKNRYLTEKLLQK